MAATEHFAKWGLGFSGCDGGDIGSSENPSVWICGLEWGGGHDCEGLVRELSFSASLPPEGYDSWKENVSYIFNWQVMKLLAVMNGLLVSQYKQFAEKVKPFVAGEKGYFKMNLYPIGFRNTSAEHWQEGFSKITGFSSKAEYLAWANDSRLAKISEWSKAYSPEMVICLGKNYRHEFGSAFGVPSSAWSQELIDEKEISWAVNNFGTLICVLPFMVNRNGLVRNASIQKFGERISQLRLDRGLKMSAGKV